VVRPCRRNPAAPQLQRPWQRFQVIGVAVDFRDRCLPMRTGCRSVRC
jgi:hypothetical protein